MSKSINDSSSDESNWSGAFSPASAQGMAVLTVSVSAGRRQSAQLLSQTRSLLVEQAEGAHWPHQKELLRGVVPAGSSSSVASSSAIGAEAAATAVATPVAAAGSCSPQCLFGGGASLGCCSAGGQMSGWSAG